MKNQTDQNMYVKLQRFADLTKTLIALGNIKRAKLCLHKAGVLFTNGNAQIKNAISNVYVFSVSTYMEMHNCSIKNLFPESLINTYKDQVNASGT